MVKSWLNIEGKVAMVTGGASGIGMAVAQELLDNGVDVIVCDLCPDKPEFDINENSGHIEYKPIDITDYDSVKMVVDEVEDEFGSIDILVNNAGINIPRLLIDAQDPNGKYELDDRVFDKIMNVNVKGAFYCAQAVGRKMVNRGDGVIINMSSESGLEGSEGQSIYAASKNAINSLTRSWAKELGKKGVRVLGVAPGILEATGLRTIEYETALSYTRGITVDELRKGYSKTSTTPLGRSGKLREVADLVCYLASDRASYIAGVTYNVAGGKTRG